MPAVVSDTSPLIYLSWIGHFDLLRGLYGTVLIPTAVWNEMIHQSAAQTGARELDAAVAAGWIKVEVVRENPKLVALAAGQIDAGELNAISLAHEHHAILIMDDLDGRLIARQLGVEVTGTLGVLTRAKREALIPALRPVVLRLMHETNFRLAPDIVDSALADVGESPL